MSNPEISGIVNRHPEHFDPAQYRPCRRVFQPRVGFRSAQPDKRRNALIVLMVVLSLFIGSKLHAQEFKPLKDNSMLLNGLSQQAEMKTFQASFTETKSISFVTDDLVSKGKLAYSEEGLIRWEYLEPDASIMIISPEKTMVSENGKTKELKAMGAVMKRIKELIGSCITGDILTDDDYQSSFVVSEAEYRVELVPLQRRVKQMVELIQIDFDMATFQINSMLMLDPSGDQTTIAFEDISVNKDLPSDVFKLN